MKNPTHNRLSISIALISLVIALLLPIASCEPAMPLQIKNETDQALYISMAVSSLRYIGADAERFPVGEVKPGDVLRPGTLQAPRYLIEAKDVSGNIVYSRDFSYEEMKSIKWKVTITKSQ